MSPLPPGGALNSSVSLASEISSTRPSGTRMRSPRTWRPNVPSAWWFLPWTSQATIPPSVTYCVPGTTGGANPRGRKIRFSSASEKPASARRTPVAASNAISRSARDVETTCAPLRAGSDASP